MAASMMRLQRDDASLDCPCADCLNQAPPRTIASLSPSSPTAADLYVMKLHEEAIHNSHSDQSPHAPGDAGHRDPMHWYTAESPALRSRGPGWSEHDSWSQWWGQWQWEDSESRDDRSWQSASWDWRRDQWHADDRWKEWGN